MRVWDYLVEEFTSHDYIPEWLNLFTDNLLELVLDIGQIRDWNRHRSLIRVLPLIEPIFADDTKVVIMANPENDKVDMANPENDKVDSEFNNFVKERLDKLLPFVDTNNLYTLPLGTQVKLFISGPINKYLYTLLLREKEGGHTSYRNTAKELLHRW
jgi:hypothetical protein